MWVSGGDFWGPVHTYPDFIGNANILVQLGLEST